MLNLFYFDWNGTTKELEAYTAKYKAACEKHNVSYKGCYSPSNEKWHYTIIVEAPEQTVVSYDVFNSPFADAGLKPPQMGHAAFRYLVPSGM